MKAKTPGPREQLENRIAWWREARFGMFIHWGLYALPAGRWEGQFVPGIGEWIMYQRKIPVRSYEQLAKSFNPVSFDAEAWVKVAVEAGMKYLVITAKHHDGFALFHSKSDKYNIIDATPFARDPMKELATACEAAGIKLCFYYSQDQDWHHPGGSGNTWDYPNRTPKDFTRYLQTKVKPQLRELLTQYGPIGLIWFDTPFTISKAQSRDLKKFVHSLQPDCLVSGRVGHDVGDYGSFGDNQIPVAKIPGDWETPATLNDTWGYKTDDKNWKSVEEILYLLVDLASKGANYLLNVGPTAKGVIPAASIRRLQTVGKWLDTHGEAIYGTEAGPFPYELEGLRFTTKGNLLYVFLTHWPAKGRVAFAGLKSRVKKAWLLPDPSKLLSFEQNCSGDAENTSRLEVSLPGKKTRLHISVLALELESPATVEKGLLQQPDGTISLPACMGKFTGKDSPPSIVLNRVGHTQGWTQTDDSVQWSFSVDQPGTYLIELNSSVAHRQREWMGGHVVRARIAGKSIRKTIRNDGWRNTPRAKYFPEAITRLGTVTIRKPGTYEATLELEKFNERHPHGLIVSSMELRPSNS